MPRDPKELSARRALVVWRVLPVLAAAVAVIAVMAVVAMRSTATADRARRAQVVTQHLRGESLRVEGITWRALAGGAPGRKGSVRSVASGFATYRRMLADLRELRELGVSRDLLGPIERELGTLTEAGLAANAHFDSDVPRARDITTGRFSPALARFMAEIDRAATAQGVAARRAQRRA
ncbi:MAG TPA: hypothetical protein VN238_17450, partial [Solirubrobacteraceae bacterium]|nr:hypothetical protein [Solirubrobacteraceae bacterium]